jgi:nucleoside recognition membrane protein YjiH
MKDIIITVKQQKTELKWLLACFCLAILLNVASIIIYKTSWNELFTQILWVLFFTLGFYAVSFVVRFVYNGIKKNFH